MLSSADAPAQFEMHASPSSGPELLPDIAPVKSEMLSPADAPTRRVLHGKDVPAHGRGVPQNIAPTGAEVLCSPDAPGQREMHGKALPSRQSQSSGGGQWTEAQ